MLERWCFSFSCFYYLISPSFMVLQPLLIVHTGNLKFGDLEVYGLTCLQRLPFSLLLPSLYLIALLPSNSPFLASSENPLNHSRSTVLKCVWHLLAMFLFTTRFWAEQKHICNPQMSFWTQSRYSKSIYYWFISSFFPIGPSSSHIMVQIVNIYIFLWKICGGNQLIF